MLVYNLHFAVICAHPDTEFCLIEIKHIAIKNHNKKTYGYLFSNKLCYQSLKAKMNKQKMLFL